MSNQKSSGWSQIKANLALLEKDELLDLIRDLYRLNTDNKVFLTSRLTLDNPQALAKPYRRAIRQEFNPERGLPRLNLRAARKALNDFKKASANPIAAIDMMIYYVEQGVVCTLNYGDIHEAFYNSLESVFAEAIAAINKLQNPEVVEEFRPRLKQIVSGTSGMGWGFHDYLRDVYAAEYPSDQKI
jgi:hypothetical protein